MFRGRLAACGVVVWATILGCTSSTQAHGPVPARVSILGPNPLILDISTTYHMSAHVYDASGVLIDGSVRLAWSSSDTSVAQIDSSGALSMRRLGTTVIRAFTDAGSAGSKDSVELDVITGNVVDRSGPLRH